jgi:hypothetical protein
MLSLNGARQISGNNVMMSILIWNETSNGERPTSNVQIAGRLRQTSRHFTEMPYKLFYDLQERALPVTRGRTGQQGANRLNGLTGPADHAAHVSAAKLQSENNRSAVGNFREHHVIRKFDQLANNELQELSHRSKD